MAWRLSDSWSFLKQTFREFSEDDCASQAAALAYYTVFSMPAMLVIIVAIIGFFSPKLSKLTGDEQSRQTATARQQDSGQKDSSQGKSDDQKTCSALPQAVCTQFKMLIGDKATAQLNEMLVNARTGKRGLLATIIGIVALLFGATGALAQVQAALNRAWDVKPDPRQGGLWSFLLKRVFSLGMLLGIAFLLLVSLVLTAALQAFGDLIAGWVLSDNASKALPIAINVVVSLIVIALLFAAMFKVLPDAEIRWRDVWVGAAATAAMFVLGKFLIGLYIQRSSVETAYGTAGSLAILLLWIYYSSMILLVGAEFTQVWAKRYGHQIEPSPGAVRVVQETREVRGPGQMRPT